MLASRIFIYNIVIDKCVIKVFNTNMFHHTRDSQLNIKDLEILEIFIISHTYAHSEHSEWFFHNVVSLKY